MSYACCCYWGPTTAAVVGYSVADAVIGYTVVVINVALAVVAVIGGPVAVPGQTVVLAVIGYTCCFCY